MNNHQTPSEVKNIEYEKGKAFTVVETIEYLRSSVVIKTIIEKTTGNVTVSSVDSGETLAEKSSPFDTFIQVVDGKAEILFADESFLLSTGESIVIPAHSHHMIKANVRFKIISTVIKSGYEDMEI